MNIPNSLVTVRLCAAVLTVVCLYIDSVYAKYAALAFVIIAWVSDILDGYIARRFKMQTKFGAFYDPFVDKIFVSFVLITLSDLGLIPIYLTLLMLFRDYLTQGIRSMVKAEGKIWKSEWSGKLKFGLQMTTITVSVSLLALRYSMPSISSWMYGVMFWVMIVATAEAYYALIEFIVKNWQKIRSWL